MLRITTTLVALSLIAGCATLTPEQKIANANALIDSARVFGPVLVDKGRISQSELDRAIEFLEVGVDMYVAAVSRNDPESRADANTKLWHGTLRLVALLAVEDRSDNNT